MGEALRPGPDSDPKLVRREDSQLRILWGVAIAERLIPQRGAAGRQHEQAIILGLTTCIREDSQSPTLGPALQTAFQGLINVDPEAAVLTYNAYRRAQHVSARDARRTFGLPPTGRILPPAR
jgi:hypothetical protein